MSSFNFKNIQSLEDLKFTVASIDINISSNAKKIIASGIYKPTVKLFDNKAGIMKCERHLVCEPIKNFFLDEDGEKFAILRSDKTIEFHIKGGLHERVRTANQPQDFILNRFSSELYIGGNYNEINRFNLEQGRFMKSINCSGASRLSFSEINTTLSSISKGNLSFFDTRSKNEIFSRKYDEDLVTITQDNTGLKYTIGVESGKLLEYDLRSPEIFRSIELDDYSTKICYENKSLVASTQKAIHIIEEDVNEGPLTPVIEPGFLINTFCHYGGLILIGGESSEIKTYICEKFGKIPEWIFDTTE